MAKPTDIGSNRTGMDTVPSALAEAMRDNAQIGEPGGPQHLAAVRGAYHGQSSPIGTMPVPKSLKAMATTAGKTLIGEKEGVFLDKLGERLAFERTGTRLYDALLAKIDGHPGDLPGIDAAELRTFRDQELRHFELVRQAMLQLGADPTAVTPAADVAAVASSGLLKVITDPRMTVAQSLEALLAAEEIDHGAWEMLIDLARGLGHDQLAEDFTDALVDETEHLDRIRALVRNHLMQQAGVS